MAITKPIQLSIVVSPNDLESVDNQVRAGIALNRSDFVRLAIREKIAREKAMA